MGGTLTDQSAEDAVQEAFIELAKQPQPPEDIVGWMVKVIRNRMLDWARSKQRRRKRERDHAEVRWFVATDAIDQDVDDLQRALDRLPQDQRQVVVMHLWGQMTFTQIAAATDSTRSSAHRSYQTAIKRLRERLIEPNQRVQSETAN